MEEEKERSRFNDIKRKNQLHKSIDNDRTKSRQRFMDIPLKDPRIKLQEEAIIKAKERRQAEFKNKRSNRKSKQEDDNENRVIKEAKDVKQLATIVAELSKTVSLFMKNTQSEIENLNKLINIKEEISNHNKDQVEEMKVKIKSEILEIQLKIQDIDKLLKAENPVYQTNKFKNAPITKNHKELTIKEAYVHNFNKFKNGVAVIKTGENKNIKVPLISNWKFDRRIKKWICQYKV